MIMIFLLLGPSAALGRNVPLIRLLISMLHTCILLACLYRMLLDLSFFFTFFLSSLLLIFFFENRPAPFSGRMSYKRQLNLALIFFVFISCCSTFLLVNACFCCDRFSLFPFQAKRLAWGKRLRNGLFSVELDVKPQLRNRSTGSWTCRPSVMACGLMTAHVESLKQAELQRAGPAGGNSQSTWRSNWPESDDACTAFLMPSTPYTARHSIGGSRIRDLARGGAQNDIEIT